ncbi:MAG TPA: cupin domain-containing protein [Sediminibacterium sp.]|nr:cupin domain-containing protein [Sediminibacterium sp.]
MIHAAYTSNTPEQARRADRFLWFVRSSRGGFYKETYRSKEAIPHEALPKRFRGARLFSTAIYFLLLKENFSAFHRIESDECWHFYEGASLLIHMLDSELGYRLVRLGNHAAAGEVYQAVVPAGCWFASESAGTYSFVGCTVAPGFDFADFELASAGELVPDYPEHAGLINRLCR